MAGRGTDIRLGGAAGDDGQIAALGGLHVVGAGRHGSSRLDHQLRGRAGRQGDPGSSVFFASLQDELATRHVPDARGPAAVGPGVSRAEDAGSREMVSPRSGSPKASAWRSTATPGATTSSSTSSGRSCLHSATECCGTDAALRALARQCPGPLRRPPSHRPRRGTGRRRPPDHPLAPGPGLGGSPHLPGRPARGDSPARARTRPQPARRIPRGTAVRAFSGLLAEVEERSVESFETVPITADGADLAAAGLKRPTATWTYLVQDNPFGTDIDRALRSVAQAMRRLLPS